ncbi:MAG: proline--tRNA ligase [Patescibacteria group bacterium]
MQKYSKLFGKTNKEAKEFDSINATLLQKAGFINQEMAGVYTYLPLGVRVISKIENIIREEMDKIGNEILMPSISPIDIWKTAGRLDNIDVILKAVGGNKLSKEGNDNEYILNPSHEEIVTPLAKKYNSSYKDLPFAIYQIQTKFRNEKRPKSGLLRGREFIMKDLYSFHQNKEDLQKYFESIKEYYWNIFKKLELEKDTVEVLASGGDFTKNYSTEFQVKCSTGEDSIYYDSKNNIYYNEEIVPKDLKESTKASKASEAANIFQIDTKYSKPFNYLFKDEDNKDKEVYMGCYGIGISRLMGIIVEKFNDDNGIIWPTSVAPYDVHIINVNNENIDTVTKIVDKLEKDGKSVLFDDRENITIGEKLQDADLIGIPLRILITKRSIESGGVEVKKRNEDKVNIFPIDKIKY